MREDDKSMRREALKGEPHEKQEDDPREALLVKNGPGHPSTYCLYLEGFHLRDNRDIPGMLERHLETIFEAAGYRVFSTGPRFEILFPGDGEPDDAFVQETFQAALEEFKDILDDNDYEIRFRDDTRE